MGSSGVREFGSSGVREFGSSEVREFGSSGVSEGEKEVAQALVAFGAA